MSSYVEGTREYQAWKEGFIYAVHNPVEKDMQELIRLGAIPYEYGTDEFFAWLEGYYSNTR